MPGGLRRSVGRASYRQAVVIRRAARQIRRLPEQSSRPGARPGFFTSAAGLGLVLLLTGCNRVAESKADTPAPLPSITVAELLDRLKTNPDTYVLDVRTPGEYDGPLGHIEGANLIPVQELAGRLAELQDVKGERLHIICRSGARSARATGLLLEAGFDAVNISGGMRAWRQVEPLPQP